MKQKKQVKVITGATDYYLKHIYKFLPSLHNLLPVTDYEYKVTIITNTDSNEYMSQALSCADEILGDYTTYNIKSIEFKHCPPFPWPVITLYKPFLCKEYIDDDDDFVFCGNVNIRFEQNDCSWFIPDEINVSWHHTHKDNSQPYYIQAGFVFASKVNMLALCEEWQNRINYFINKEHKVPEWHDETVLNYIFNDPAWQYRFNPSFIFKYEGQAKEQIIPTAFAELQLRGKRDKEFKENWI